jgi:DNA-binding NarL/FixJ family response regulator
VTLRILIADDHGVLRAGLRSLLNEEPGFRVVGEAESGDEVLPRARNLLPDVVLLDLNMPGADGIRVTRQIREHLPETRVLVLTVYEDEGLLREAIVAGAAGYIVKRAAEVELISAIRAVARGELYVHPSLTRALLQAHAVQAPAAPDMAEQLTPREALGPHRREPPSQPDGKARAEDPRGAGALGCGARPDLLSLPPQASRTHHRRTR